MSIGPQRAAPKSAKAIDAEINQALAAIDETKPLKPKKPKPDDLLFEDLKAIGFNADREYEFCEHRGWRIDLAWPEIKLGIEVNGRGYMHQAKENTIRDCEKTNAAIELGWRILSYPASRVSTKKRRERIVQQISRIICGVECPQSAACVLTGE